MSEGRSSSKNDPISRRQFVAGAATAIVSAIVGGIVGSQAFPKTVTETVTREATKTLTSTATVSTTIPTTITSTTTKETTTTVEKEVPASNYLVIHSDKCAGCERCMLVCSLVHEGVCSPSLSRIQVVKDYFTGNYELQVCRQCPAPSCYYACPLRDEALCIDEQTGARYINPDKCIGCKSCIKACPFDPPRIKFNKEKNISFKCDLCGGDPQCVKVCPMGAIEYIKVRQEVG